MAKKKRKKKVAPRNYLVLEMLGKGRVFLDKRKKRERKYRHKIAQDT